MSEHTTQLSLSRRQLLSCAGLAASSFAFGACTQPKNAPQESAQSLSPTPEDPFYNPGQPILMGPDFSRYDALEKNPDAHNMLASGLLDAKIMAKSGLAFCAVRATVGKRKLASDNTPALEPNYREMHRRLKDAGLVTIAYHALTDTDPVAQADYFCEATAGAADVVPAVNFEQYQSQGTYHDLTRDMLEAFTTRLLANLADPRRRLVAYIPSWMWGSPDRVQAADIHKTMSAHESVMNNPPHVPGTVLWWGRQWQASEVPSGQLLLSPRRIADLVGTEDQGSLWNRERLGTYAAPGFRQLLTCYRFKKMDGTYVTSGAKHQQFDGRVAGERLRALDWNVCYMPHDELLGLAGMKPGSLPLPTALAD